MGVGGRENGGGGGYFSFCFIKTKTSGMRQILVSERKKSPEMEKGKFALPEGNDLTVDNSGLKESK